MYTGGTVQHLYLGESIEDIMCAKLIQKVFTNYKMPYIDYAHLYIVTNMATQGEISCPQWVGKPRFGRLLGITPEEL